MRYHLTSLSIAMLVVGTLAHSETLDPVIVTANNMEQPLSTVTSPTYVITREDIEQHNWITLIDALKNLPGISYTQNGGMGTSAEISIRGQRSNALLVLIDGIPIADPSNTKLAPHFENLFLGDAERIEVSMGPQSSIWGSNASAGVINIITQKGRNRFSITAGSENTRIINTKLHARSKTIKFTTSFNTIATDGFTAIKPYNSSDNGYEKDSFNQQDVAFSIQFAPIEHHHIKAGIRQNNSSLEYDFSSPNDSGDTTSYTILKYLGYKYKQTNWKTLIQLSENKTEREYFGTYSGTLTTFEGRSQWNYQNQDTFIFQIGSQKISGNKPGSYGFNSKYWHDYYNLTHQHKIKNIQLIESLRQDNFNKFNNKTTGKLGFKIPLSDLLNLSANYGTAYNAPSAYQIAMTSATLQNGSLKPESTEGWDTTLSAQNLSLTYFKSKTDDLIQYDMTSYSGYYNMQGTADYEGWTLDYHHNWKTAAISINATIQKATNSQGKKIIRVPQQAANITLEYFGNPQTDLIFTLNYIGDYYEQSGSNIANIGQYATVDATINYALTQHFTVFAKAINLFDRDYYLATDQKKPPQYGYNTGGFQWRIGLRGDF